MDLANKVGTTDAMTVVQTAIQMQQGTIPVSTMATVTALQQDPAILVTAHDTLTPSEYNRLCRGIRDHVHTACGRQWEDAALDRYERAVGYPVTQRNCELLTWPFVAAATAVSSATTNDVANGNDVATVVVPLRRPSRRTSPYAAPTTTTTTSTSVTHEKQEPPDQVNEEDIVPYFSIVGSVDGVREEMAPVAPKQNDPSTKPHDQNMDHDSIDTDDDDDEEWEMRHIIVECKHRMRRLCPVPPLYELIQTAIYCLMYEYQYADIVQVLRSSTSTTTTTLSATHIEEDHNTRKNDTTNQHDTTGIHNSITTTCSTDDATKTSNGNLANTERVDPVRLSASETNDATHGPTDDDDHVAISVYRLNVDDPILQHRANFYTTILPRLQRFTQAVYDWRHDDSQRYALLYAVLVGGTNGGSSSNDDHRDNTISAWKMIQEKCPWLPDDCIGMDTSRTRTV